MSTYTYSIANDTSNSLLNSSVLNTTIEDSSISSVCTEISTHGDNINIKFEETLTVEDKNTLDSLVSNHDGTPTEENETIQELDAEGFPVTRVKGMYIDTTKTFYGRGFSSVATAGQASNMDYTLVSDAHIDKVDIYLQNQSWGDYMSFQIVHPTYGVVNEFGDNWFVNSSREKQEPLDPPQISNLIPAGMILRILYTSTGLVNVDFKCNFHFQEPINA